MKKNKLKRLIDFKISRRSIAVKWTLLTAIVISILFTVFAFLAYRISVSVMISEEKAVFDRTMTEVSTRLSRGTQPLNFENSIFYLRKSEQSNLDIYDDYDHSESKVVNLNGFIAELSRPEYDLKVYTPDGTLLFEMKDNDIPLDKALLNETVIQQNKNQVGLYSLRPIMSKENGRLIGYAQGFYDLETSEQFSQKLLSRLILIGSIGLVVSIIVSFFLAAYFTAPLRKMSKVLNSVEDAHRTGVRMAVPKTNDEMMDLANAFNDMIERMDRFIAQQQQFVEDVSHELRTPVAVIEGHLSLLNRWGKSDPEVLEESLKASLQEITRMKSLVQEMLDLSRAEQSDIHYKDETCDAYEVIEATVNNFKMLYPDFVFHLDNELDEQLRIKMYRNHFEQILIIILDNAVKYSTNRFEVMVSAAQSYRYIDIAIQDFGEGIAQEDLDRVFNRFYRVDKARDRNTGGNGLGLSIAEQLLESYAGNISVKSQVGSGTAFYISIPIAIETFD